MAFISQLNAYGLEENADYNTRCPYDKCWNFFVNDSHPFLSCYMSHFFLFSLFYPFLLFCTRIFFNIHICSILNFLYVFVIQKGIHVFSCCFVCLFAFYQFPSLSTGSIIVFFKFEFDRVFNAFSSRSTFNFNSFLFFTIAGSSANSCAKVYV